MNKVKRILAIAGIIFIASMYLISFISAFLATKYSNGLFLASIFSTVVIPILIWWALVIYKWVHKQDNTDPMLDSDADPKTHTK